MKTIYCFITFLFILSNQLQAQTYNLPEQKHFEKGKIALLNFEKHDAIDIEIGDESVKFKDRLSNEQREIAFADINYLRLRDGNKLGYGLTLGGITASVICLRVIMESGGGLSIGGGAVIIVGITALGGLIGASTPRWKTYYLGNDIGMIKPNIYFDQNSFGVLISFQLK